jgi:hypothetical protein
MKILLLGEYSALHKNLKEGLQELGHDVTTVASSDGFKKIYADVSLDPILPSTFGKVERTLRHLRVLKWIKNYDIVQVINPFIFHPFFLLSEFYRTLKRNNGKLFFLAAGDDAYYWSKGKSILRYGPFDDTLKYDLNARKSIFENEKLFELNRGIVENSDGIIPVMYEYEVSYQDSSKRRNTIPLPVNSSKIKYQRNKPDNKTVVFHGLNRYGFKGTRHVEKAFSILRAKYPNDLELVIDGNMPLNKYLAVMSRANVIIDQTNSYSMGMNGIYAMAMGKVVMGGAEPESLSSLGVENSPAINILPSYISLIREIELLLDRKNEIEDIGFRSRIFVENVHDNVKIALKYLSVWKGG